MDKVEVFPLFRSKAQAGMLADLYVTGKPWRVIDLANRHGITRTAMSRIVRNLRSFGFLRDAPGGVEVNPDAPFYEAMKQLVIFTIGVPLVVAEELSEIPGIDKGYIFGSWAARSSGEHGLPPNDIDVVAIGKGLTALNTAPAANAAERRLRHEVNILPTTWEEWNNPDSVPGQLQDRPLLQLNLKPVARAEGVEFPDDEDWEHLYKSLGI